MHLGSDVDAVPLVTNDAILLAPSFHAILRQNAQCDVWALCDDQPSYLAVVRRRRRCS